MPISSYERNLYCSIGRVACESANTEQILRATLRGYSVVDEAYTVIYEGQSYEWLAECIRTIFKAAFDVLLENHPEYRMAKTNYDAVNGALIDIRPLRDKRNFIIHGTWSICPGEDECRATPSHSENHENPGFHFSRSRSRRYWQEQVHLTALDIAQLAESIETKNETLSAILARAKPVMTF